MQDSHTRPSLWFWGACLVSTHTQGMSAVQFQRQLGLKRYETAFQILHKLRAGMVRPDRDRIGGAPDVHVEVDESLVGGATRGEGRSVHDKTLVACAVEVRKSKRKGKGAMPRRGGRYASRIRLEVVPDRSAKSLCGFDEAAVEPHAVIVTDAWPAYADLPDLGYRHLPVTVAGAPDMIDDYLPLVHIAFSNLKSWPRVAITGSTRNTFKPTSMSLSFGLTGDFAHLTRSGRCSEPAVGLPVLRMRVYTRVSGNVRVAAAVRWLHKGE